MIITGAAPAYAVWNLFIKYPKGQTKKPAPENGDKPET